MVKNGRTEFLDLVTTSKLSQFGTPKGSLESRLNVTVVLSPSHPTPCHLLSFSGHTDVRDSLEGVNDPDFLRSFHVRVDRVYVTTMNGSRDSPGRSSPMCRCRQFGVFRSYTTDVYIKGCLHPPDFWSLPEFSRFLFYLDKCQKEKSQYLFKPRPVERSWNKTPDKDQSHELRLWNYRLHELQSVPEGAFYEGPQKIPVLGVISRSNVLLEKVTTFVKRQSYSFSSDWKDPYLFGVLHFSHEPRSRQSITSTNIE